ncbi:hypothetical protein C8Q72DRAFT_885684 [Fomitopsis betulina]|nr:hypothetical protein C8Q72DRAFT_885684 [Fomitopsis betulina]
MRALSVGLFFVSLVRYSLGAGNVTCASNALDWYTDVVGETPCMTYQRLRQICNSKYEVSSLRSATPGDQCDDQLNTCCCNSVAFALSMLCLNCQWDSSNPNFTGYDAGKGAYYLYRWSESGGVGQYCGAGTNQSLPTNIQAAVCNQNIRLDDFLYGLFWTDGSWYYEYTREDAEQTHATNNNKTFSHCPNNSEPSSSSSIPHSSTASSTTGSSNTSGATQTSSSGKSHVGAVVGGVVGGVGGVAAVIAIAALVIARRKRTRGHVLDIGDGDPDSRPMSGLDNPPITPFTARSSEYTEHFRANSQSASESHALLQHSAGSSTTGSSPSANGSQIRQSKLRPAAGSVAPSTTAATGTSSVLTTQPIVEEDAGRITDGDMRLPPAYRDEWREE